VRQEMDSIRQLVECYDARSRLSLSLERLGLTADLVMQRPGMHINEVRPLGFPGVLRHLSN
jgi:hypothetical protein